MGGDRRVSHRRAAADPTRAVALFLFTVMSLPALGRAAASDAALRQAILSAEHNRARSETDLAVLTDAAGNSDPAIQCLAVRALGRLERPELADHIRPLLAAPSPEVRCEAATAYGRALLADRLRAAEAGAHLRERLAGEGDAEVRAALCQVLGRLPYQTAGDYRAAEAALVAATRSAAGHDAPAAVLLGAARGIESLVRLSLKLSPPAAATVERLQELASSAKEDVVRRLALAALVASAKADAAFLTRVLQDRDVQVRRQAVRGAASLSTDDRGADAIISRSLKDPSSTVRYEALAAYGRRGRAEGCRPILAAVKDPTPFVALQAVDLLAGVCPAHQMVVDTLAQIADKLPAKSVARGWHAPAHALVALSKVAPEAARSRLTRFAEHPQWQVRAYAARAAANTRDHMLLEKLACDPVDNVRTATLGGLITNRRHEADALYLQALAARDYQLISTAARGLTAAPDKAGAVTALIASLARLTAEHRDTSRDPRIAILQRLRELGSAEHATALEPYLADFDPRVAALAAEVLASWTGTRHVPVTRALDPGPAPRLAEIEALANATAIVRMRTGGSFELHLLSADAPATVLRFVQLARSGYYAGLTFHRVEPNFVIQGGSPGANEYMGDARYMRDELGRLMHARGTVGISTRGRDTGDAQIFINLVDNPRLDPDYTVFAAVVRGMDVVEGVLEGDVIDRVEIRTARAGARACGTSNHETHSPHLCGW